MALTVLMQQWVQTHGGSLVALTVDHRLRPESTDEAAQVARWMAARGIAHHTLTPPHDVASNNLQEAARTWRYDALAAFCTTHGILDCVVAHHAGDNRETAVLQAARGDTADGGAGMRAVRNYRGVRFLRPLLTVERAALEELLRAEHIAWIDDLSNRDPRFARVRSRTSLAGDDALRRTLDASLAQEAAERAARDATLAAAAMRLVTFHPLGFAEFSAAAWRALEPRLASQLLADCLTTIGGQEHRPRAADTARLSAALAAPMRKQTLHRCEITLRGDRVRIAREAARVAPPLTLSGDGQHVWDGRFRVRTALPAGESWTLGALGTAGRSQLRQAAPALADLPVSTPVLRGLDERLIVPHIEAQHLAMPNVRIGFAPPKPLAAAPFWWLKDSPDTDGNERR
jgi:tRNA(Ile)-lysidine synthase